MQLTTFARLAVALSATASASAQLRLTNVFQFSSDSTGTQAGGQLWDTFNAASFAIWVSANGSPVNGQPGDTANRSVDFELTPGVYDFQIWGQPGGAATINFGAMNLFFDGSSAAGISVFAETQNAPGPAMGFMANNSASTFGPVGGTIPASGSLAYSDGGVTATLTSYFYANPTAYGQDIAQGRNRIPGSGLDFYGEFTLEVVPAPATAALIAGAGLCASRKRR